MPRPFLSDSPIPSFSSCEHLFSILAKAAWKESYKGDWCTSSGSFTVGTFNDSQIREPREDIPLIIFCGALNEGQGEIIEILFLVKAHHEALELTLANSLGSIKDKIWARTKGRGLLVHHQHVMLPEKMILGGAISQLEKRK